MRSSARATAGEIPQRPFTSLDIVFRLTPKRSAHSVTVQPSASMLSHRVSLVVINKIYVHGFSALKAEYDTPITRYPNTPLPTSVTQQRMKKQTGQIHVERASCRL